MKTLKAPPLLLASLVIAAPVAAQGQQAPAAADNAKDPAAMAALDRMGAALRAQTNFTVHSGLTAEDVLASGQKIQYGGTLDIAARRPTKLRMVLKMGPSERQLYYDGASLTLYSPDKGAYATARAPATIGAALAAAEDEYGLYIPMTDLFLWGEDPSLAAKITSAISLPKEVIGGQVCEHYAMRQAAADWQIWIREGDNALPCKLVITTTTDPAMPQVTSVYHWQSEAVPDEAAFTFQPPEKVIKIAFQPLRPAASSNAGK
ncbi:MAG TPA: DUF2092 domain-containing protein [Sphingomicrobium sp.]|nr:DUF2092 domain-containing protein [Sphingomicrobium sp.]